MEKIKQWVATLENSTPWSRIAKVQIKDGDAERYQAEVSRGKLLIKAESLLAAANALLQLEVARKAGHLPDFLGNTQPAFNFRPLWLDPSIIKEDLLDRYCRRTIELGFNAWLVGNHHEGMFTSLTPPAANIRSFHEALHSYGLKLIVKPRLFRTFDYSAVCPLDVSYKQELKRVLTDWLDANGTPDAIFWESPCKYQGFENSPKAKEYLRSDLAVFELKMLESILERRTNLIYYLPSQNPTEAKHQSSCMKILRDAASTGTVLAFSAFAGSPFDDHLPPHPYWEELRRVPEPSQTPLMPILNCGAIEQGEGLWPSLPLDLIQTYIPRSRQAHFAGIAIPAASIPAHGGFLDASLWIAGQAQWRNLPPEMLAETWFLSHLPKENFTQNKYVIENLRLVVKEISYVRSLANQPGRNLIPPPDCRPRIEGIIAQIKYLDTLFNSTASATSDTAPGIKEYYPFFTRDAKKMLSQLAQYLGVPTPHLMQGHDQGDGFWTDLTYPEGEKKWRRTSPRQGSPGSTMAKILSENRFEINE